MVSKPPYMLAPGVIPKILEKIQQARRPDRFTLDFLSTKLGHSSSSARPIIPLLKRMGFLNSDGSPTSRYDQFRNAETQGIAVADGIKAAFSDLLERNEYAYDLSRDKLTSLVIEETGAAKTDRTTKAIVGTFMALNDLADFEADRPMLAREAEPAEETRQHSIPLPSKIGERPKTSTADNVDFKVSYTINLNLPETTNPDVFNAIFRSLKDHLLRD